MNTSRQILINANPSETRVAIIENEEELTQLFIERHDEQGLVGNVYVGKVVRVLPGMQSAFVEIGIGRPAFLFAGDIVTPDKSASGNVMAKYLQEEETDEEHRRSEKDVPIEKLIKAGHAITVQVAKDPIGTKGARVTTYLSIPGRYLVILPDHNQVNISKRISDEKVRVRLKSMLEKIRPKNVGIIVRTLAQEAEPDQIKNDLFFLVDVLKRIKQRSTKKGAGPVLLYQEPKVHLRIARDYFGDDVTSIIADDKDAFKELKEFLKVAQPKAYRKLHYYDKSTPLFDAFEIELDIAKALGKKVWLPSGGYLIIEQTEALTSFDVNTGKFVGRFSARDTILKTNMEAVPVIVAQLRLRNIGGIIVIDFIDMDHQHDRDKVYHAFEEELRKDKAKTNILRINELGLLEMTRKRTSESLERKLTSGCPHCDGTGNVRSVQTQALDVIRDIDRACLQMKTKHIQVRVRRDIKDWLLQHEKQFFFEVCKKHQVKVEFLKTNVAVENLSEPAYEIQPLK